MNCNGNNLEFVLATNHPPPTNHHPPPTTRKNRAQKDKSAGEELEGYLWAGVANTFCTFLPLHFL